MTLIVCCYTPTGIALSGDSRTTGWRMHDVPQAQAPGATHTLSVQIPWILSDSARKVFCLSQRFMVATWGDAFIGNLPVAHHVSEFGASLGSDETSSVSAFSEALLKHFATLAPTANLSFVVAGYDAQEPFVIEVSVAQNSTMRRNTDNASGVVNYGAIWGGDYDIVTRLVTSAMLDVQRMNLQDAVDFSRHLIRTTINQMRFEARIASVGGHIDTATSTPVRTKFLARKELRAGDG